MTWLTLFSVAVVQLFQPSSATSLVKNEYGSMGAVGFAWPVDRAWDFGYSLTAPCGSSGVGNRTEFPLTNGTISIAQRQQAYDFQVSITYGSDPDNSSVFLPITPLVSSLEYTRLCLDLETLPASAAARRDATLQLKYTSTWYGLGRHHNKRHMAVNETFYACADVTLVESADFAFDWVPSCFNITADYENGGQWTDLSWDNGDDDDDDTNKAEAKGGVGGSGVSAGALAGIVVGGFLAVALIAAIVAWGCYLARRGKKSKAQKAEAKSEEGSELSVSEQIAAAKKLDDSDRASLSSERL